MTHRLVTCLAAALLVLSIQVATSGEAQAQVRVGPHGGYNFEGDGQGFLGLDAWIGVTKLGESIELHANPEFSFYFIENVTWMRFDVNAPFLFSVGGDMVKPYAAPGLSLHYVSVDLGPLGEASDTSIGLNAIVGALFLTNMAFQPFAQFRYTVLFEDGDADAAEIMGGVMYKF